MITMMTMTLRRLAPAFLFVPVALASALALTACRSAGAGPDVRAEGSSASAIAPAAPAFVPKRSVGIDPGHVGMGTPLTPKPGMELAAFAGGCFWGVEDVFRQVPGVTATAVGFTGGTTQNPSYEEVCTHTTGHAEAVLIEFDPSKISYPELLTVFFKNHDPTTMNRQGPDVGNQYRSAVFTFSDAQAAAVRTAIATESKDRAKSVVTRVAPVGAFYKAEEYHQQYDEKTGTHSCPLPKGLPKGA